MFTLHLILVRFILRKSGSFLLRITHAVEPSEQVLHRSIITGTPPHPSFITWLLDIQFLIHSSGRYSGFGGHEDQWPAARHTKANSIEFDIKI